MVSSNQLFIRVLKEGSSFFNDLPRLKRGHCIWPVVTGKDNNEVNREVERERARGEGGEVGGFRWEDQGKPLI